MSVLFPHLPFDPAETPLSFATRLATFHIGQRLVPFLHDMGIRSVDLVTGDRGAIERLAAVAGTDPEDLLHNAPVWVGKRRYDLRGNRITAEFLSSPHTAFCPACLVEDDHRREGQGGRLGRFDWTLRPVRTCPTHRLPLVLRRKERWDDQFRELDVRVPECGEALEDLARSLTPRDTSPLQDYVLARLNGHAGPSWLDGQTLEQAVRATEMLGVLLEYGATPDLNLLTEDQWDRAGTSGFGYTSRGETGIGEALALAHAAHHGAGRPGRRSVFGRLYEWLSYSRPAEPPGDIKRILREYIFETMEVGPDEVILGETIGRRRLHSVESLAKAWRLDPRTLRNVLVAKNLIPVSASVEGYHLFDAEAGDAAAASVKRAVHVISMPKVLNCTRPQFDQLVQERVLTPLSGGRNIALGRTQKGIDGDQVSAFLAALETVTRPVTTVPARFVPLGKAAEKAKVPTIDIVHALLAGFLETAIRLETVAGLGAIHVDPTEVKEVIKNRMLGLSASAVADALTLLPRDLWTMVDLQTEPFLPSIIVDGKNGYRFHRFDRGTVEAFRMRYVSERGLADALGILRTDLIRRIKDAGVRPVLAPPDVAVEVYWIEDLPPSLRPPKI
jgi:hypothetical protein